MKVNLEQWGLTGEQINKALNEFLVKHNVHGVGAATGGTATGKSGYDFIQSLVNKQKEKIGCATCPPNKK
jgi:hypothetical protein